MKRKSLIFNSILAVSIIFGSILYHSCSKDENLQKNKDTKTEVSANDQMLEQQIMSFRDKLKSTEKSTELVELDDATWYLDAVLNYSYSFPYVEYSSYFDSSSLVTMEISNNEVAFTELVNTYNEIEEVLRKHFFAIDDENKHLSTISIVKTENSTENLIEFEILSTVGVYSTNKSGKATVTDPFGEDDWWLWGYEYGKCGPYSEEEVGMDAAKKISFAIRRHYNTSNIMYYYLYSLEILTPIYPSDLPDGWLFISEQDNCLSPGDMNNYYYQSFKIIDLYDPNDGRVLKNYWLQGDLIGGIGWNAYLHRVERLEYGEKHKRGSIPHDLTEG